MTWTPKKLNVGALRSAELYADLVGRSNHLLANYLPAVGGVSPLSMETSTGALNTLVANAAITPCTCEFELHIVYKAATSGSGIITVTYDGGSHSSGALTSTAPAVATITGMTGSGDAEKAAIYVRDTASEITVYGGIFVPRADNTTGLTDIPPKAQALASGYPISTDAIRRLMAAPRNLMVCRRAALAYFCARDRGVSEDSERPEGPIDIAKAFTFTPYNPAPSFKLAQLAPVSTVGTLYGDGGASVSITSTTAVAVETTAAVATSKNLWLEFSGPVEAYVVYEDV